MFADIRINIINKYINTFFPPTLQLFCSSFLRTNIRVQHHTEA